MARSHRPRAELRDILGSLVRLITIPISHYCEKARWALHRAGISYREERHVQGLHRVAARRAGGGNTVPVLVSGEQVLGESRDILRWADERTPVADRLFPEDPAALAEVQSLCERFDERLGPTGRRLIYVRIFGEPRSLVLHYNDQGVPAWEDRVLRAGWPLAKRFVAHALSIRAGIEVADEQTVFAEFDHVAALLADGRHHLCGERFTAADLTFAALAAAVLAPPQYSVALPQPHELSPVTAELIERARDHPAGRYALAMFAEHRR